MVWASALHAGRELSPRACIFPDFFFVGVFAARESSYVVQI